MAKSPSRPRHRRLELVAGRDGLRVTWDDGSVTTCAPGEHLLLEATSRRPVSIAGRALVAARRGGELGFEAPMMLPFP